VHPLRGESDNSLPKACLTRERGARECRAAARLDRAPSHAQLTHSEIRPTESVQPAEGKGAVGRSATYL